MERTLPPIRAAIPAALSETLRAVPLLLASAIAIAVLWRAGYWLIARPTFEDALITYTHARNAAEGLGLTHHLGEAPVHGFTSALSVLIPLAGELVVRGSGLDLLRALSLVAAGATLFFAYRIGKSIGLGKVPIAFALLYLAIDRNHVFYGVAGMETQVAVAILLGSIAALLDGRYWLFGVSLGLACLVRPDFALWAGIAIAFVAFRGRLALSQSLLPAALLVAPWILFTTVYYGSPIPNTVLAKAAVNIPSMASGIVPWLQQQMAGSLKGIAFTFAPFYSDSNVASAMLPREIALALSLAIFVLAWVGARATWRTAAWRPVIVFAGAFFLYRLLLLPGAYYGWYLPPFTAVMVLLAAAGLQRISGLLPRWRSQFATSVSALVILPLALHVPLETAFFLDRYRQEPVPVLQQVGEYLRSHVGPGEGVTAEAAGYIGFHSGTTLYDWPGLTSRVSLTALLSLPQGERSLAAFIDRLQPEWLVLRGWELDEFRARFSKTAERYTVRASFEDAGTEWKPGEPMPEVGIPGYRVWAFWARFFVLERVG